MYFAIQIQGGDGEVDFEVVDARETDGWLELLGMDDRGTCLAVARTRAHAYRLIADRVKVIEKAANADA